MHKHGLFAGLGMAWMGTLGTITLSHLSIAMGVASFLFSTATSLLVAKATIRTRKAEAHKQEAEAHKQEIEADMLAAKLCAACRSGTPPPVCPFPLGVRPGDCPQTQNEKLKR